MFFSLAELKAAVHALHEAHKNPDQRCTQPRRDDEGKTGFSGTDGSPVPYGAHGAAFLEVDPATGEIRCRLCRNGNPATASPKMIVRRGRRFHAVSR